MSEQRIISIVERFQSEKEWTLSEFFIPSVKPEKFGVGVEDEYRAEKLKGETRIGNGTYELALRDSPKFSSSYFVDADGFLSNVQNERFTKPHQLIWVKDVPNFEFVLWHWGNSDLDTDGCYIVGSYFGQIEVINPRTKLKEMRRGVVSSRVKYIEMYPIMWRLITAAQKAGEKVFTQYRDKNLAA